MKKRVVIIGLGNIGSHLALLIAPLLAACRNLAELVLVDHDRYEPKNRHVQAIGQRDVGRNKAIAQARRLRSLCPSLRIVARPCRLEELSFGEWRADAVVTCLDSRAARVAANRRIWRMGTPWIDTGVSADNRLARVSVFRPALEDQACYECGWSDADYASLEVRRSCVDDFAPATGAPAALGALAASLAALEVEKILNGQWEHVAAGREIVLSATWHTHFVSALKRGARCRFDHGRLPVEDAAGVVPEKLVLGEFFSSFAPKSEFAFRVEGTPWLTSQVCRSCHASADGLVLRGRAPAEAARCSKCGGALLATGMCMREEMPSRDFKPEHLALPLSAFGIRPREVVTFSTPDPASNRSLLLHAES